MKLFTFIGKTLDDVQALTGSLLGTTITVSNTVGQYATIQLSVAKQEEPIALAEARFEGQARLLELRKKIDNINKADDTPVSDISIDDLLTSMGGE